MVVRSDSAVARAILAQHRANLVQALFRFALEVFGTMEGYHPAAIVHVRYPVWEFFEGPRQRQGEEYRGALGSLEDSTLCRCHLYGSLIYPRLNGLSPLRVSHLSTSQWTYLIASLLPITRSSGALGQACRASKYHILTDVVLKDQVCISIDVV
jgi:hypothetical protein